MKVHDKNTPKQTKEEEIGSYPEKKFGIMRERWPKSWKLSGLASKYTGGPDWEERSLFTMHLEEIKKKKKSSNNYAITEISKAVEGTKSKISETEKELT